MVGESQSSHWLKGKANLLDSHGRSCPKCHVHTHSNHESESQKYSYGKQDFMFFIAYRGLYFHLSYSCEQTMDIYQFCAHQHKQEQRCNMVLCPISGKLRENFIVFFIIVPDLSWHELKDKYFLKAIYLTESLRKSKNAAKRKYRCILIQVTKWISRFQ